MKKIVFFTLLVFSTSLLFAQNIGDYRTVASGNWSNIAIWEAYGLGPGNDWYPATEYPDWNDGEITLSHSVNMNINSLTIDQTVNSGGTLTINSGTLLTVRDGSGYDLSNSSMIVNHGTITNNGTIRMYPDMGSYEHARDGGIIPSIEWGSGGWGGRLYITGIINTTPVVNTQTSLAPVTWNCPSQSAQVNFDTDLSSSLIVTHTGTGSILIPAMTLYGVTQSVNSKVKLGGSIVIPGTYTYTNNGYLICESNTISGNGNFNLGDNATFMTGHSEGINGNIINTGTKTFGVANYIYNRGTQVTGSYLPLNIASLTRHCYTKDPYDLTLTNPYVSIRDSLSLVYGRVFIPSDKYIELGTKASITYDKLSSDNMIVLDDALSFVKKDFANLETFIYPLGTKDGTIYELTPVSIDVAKLTGVASILIFTDDTSYDNPGWTYYLDRYWFVRLSGDISYEGTLTYVPADIIGGDDSKIVFGRHLGSGSWDYKGGFLDPGQFALMTEETNNNYYFSGIQQKTVTLDVKVYLQGAYR